MGFLNIVQSLLKQQVKQQKKKYINKLETISDSELLSLSIKSEDKGGNIADEVRKRNLG